MSQCVLWLSAPDIWGGNIADLAAGNRFTSGLHFQVVKRTRQHSRALTEADVSRIANSGLMRVSATLDSWIEGGSRLNIASSLGINIFAPKRGSDFTGEPTRTEVFDGEIALTLAPFGHWAGLGAREHSVPEVQDWKVDEIFAFRNGPDSPSLFWLEDWERREDAASVDIKNFGPDDNCALVVSRWSDKTMVSTNRPGLLGGF